MLQSQSSWEAWKGRALILPAFTFGLFFFVAPLGTLVTYSFWERTGAELVREWTLANYQLVFQKPYLVGAILNSIEVALTATVASVVLGYSFAYLIAYRIPPRWQRLALLLAIVPFWTSYVVRSYSLLLILSDTGVVNHALRTSGLTSEPIALSPNRLAVILGFTHFFSMLVMVSVYSKLIQIPGTFHKAAEDLGASKLQAFLRVTLPLSMPSVLVGAFLTFVICIGDYATPQILGGNRELLLSQIIVLEVQTRGNFPLASALSLMLLGLVLLAFAPIARQMSTDRL